MTKHTPGPWHYAECQMGAPFIDTEAVGDLVAAVLPIDEERANVRLMAAAPDLLAACERLLMSADASWRERGVGHDWDEACEVALAAMAKARGEP